MNIESTQDSSSAAQPPIRVAKGLPRHGQLVREGRLEHNMPSRFKLTRLVYRELSGSYPWHSWYVLGAREVATTILKNYRKHKRKGLKAKKPEAKRLVAKIGNQTLKIEDGKLRMPLRHSPRRLGWPSLRAG